MKDLQRLMLNSGIAPETVDLIIAEGRKQWGGDKTYWTPMGSSKDPERAEAIRKAAKTLPTGIVVQRFGVSRQYIHRITKKRN